MQNLKEVKEGLDNIDFEKVGRRIQYIRKSRKITQADLSAICGCTSNHLSAIENGVNKPSIELIMKISVVLEESVDYFLMDAPHAYLTYLIDAQISEKLSRCNVKMLQTINGILDYLLEYQDFIDKKTENQVLCGFVK